MKIRAFTLLELLIALAVSGSILLVVLRFWETFKTLTTRHMVNNERLLERSQLLQVIQQDWAYTSTITWENKSLIFKRSPTPITYHLSDHMTIRSMGINMSDTFPVHLRLLHIKRTPEQLIQAVDLELSGDFYGSDTVLLFKNYSAVDRLTASHEN